MHYIISVALFLGGAFVAFTVIPLMVLLLMGDFKAQAKKDRSSGEDVSSRLEEAKPDCSTK